MPPRKLSYWVAGAIAGTALLAGLASGHSVLTGLGVIQPSTDSGLRAALGRARKQAADAIGERGRAQDALKSAREEHAATLAALQKRARDAETAWKEAEVKYAAAAGERDRAQAALKAAQDALSAAREKGEAAAGRVTELTGRLANAEQALKEAKAAAQKAQAGLKAANRRADRAEAALKQRTPHTRGDGGSLAAATTIGKVGETFKDCTNCPEMVVVPAGSFTMGSPSSEPERFDSEGPQHEVRIAKPFAVGRFEVTFAEWDACVADGGCGGYKPRDRGWGRGSRPVIYVSWNDAKAYVKWLSDKTHKEYRLLSEAEWEYVARAGTQTRYFWGNSVGRNHANCDGCGSRWDDKQTAPVGSFRPNGFGLYDTAGNVWEWVEDCEHGSYKDAPTDGSAWLTGNCASRAVRGGSWSFNARSVRAAGRDASDRESRYFNIGFRCARVR